MEKVEIPGELWGLMRQLNRREVLPQTALQRNSVYYRLVTYINHTIALYLGDSYDDAALFIARAEREWQGIVAHKGAEEAYLPLCRRYLQLLAEQLLRHNLLGQEGLAVLPDTLAERKDG